MFKQFLIVFSVGLLASCSSTDNQTPPIEESTTLKLISNGKDLADCQNLTTDNKGNPVISWVQGQDLDACFYYAVSSDNGTSFNTPIKVLPTLGLSPHHESMPKIAFKSDGTAVVVYSRRSATPKNRFAGAIHYIQSSDNGVNWTNQAYLHYGDTTKGIGRSFFDIATLPDGEVGAIWLDGRKKARDGSALFFAKTNDRNGFQNEIELDDKTCQCCRTELYIDKNDNINATYRDIIHDSIRDMVHLYSKDFGESFSAPKRISLDNWAIDGCPHTGPTMSEDKDGLHFYWFTMGGGEGVYHTSLKDQEGDFSERSLLNTSARHPQTANSTDDGVVLVWEERIETDSILRNRIGYLFEKNGVKHETIYISPDSVDAFYPVVLELPNNKTLIAWNQRGEEISQVYYQIVAEKKTN